MKRLLPLLILLIVCAGTVQAQRMRETDDQLDRQVLSVELTGPQMALLEMKRELNLSEEQLAKLELLSEQKYQHMTKAEAHYTDPLQLQRRFQDIHVELDKVIARILSEQQLKHYLELEGRQNVYYLTGKEGEE